MAGTHRFKDGTRRRLIARGGDGCPLARIADQKCAGWAALAWIHRRTPAGPDDDKDWTWVLERPCPDCGFDAGQLHRADIASLAREAMAGFANLVRRPEATRRESPAVWSPLEYGCHVRDVCHVFAGRARLMLAQDDPEFANWDQDATAREQQYWTQDPATVAAECLAAGDEVGTLFDGVADEQWQRSGRRSNGSVFTVESLGRYFAHDVVHHLHDVGA